MDSLSLAVFVQGIAPVQMEIASVLMIVHVPIAPKYVDPNKATARSIVKE